MKAPTKTWYPTKSAWARAKAAELDGQARQLEQHSGCDWRQRAKLRGAASNLRIEAGKYLIRALRFEEAGD
ncbi:MAG: hypothetical protein ACN6OU_14495 [Stenotrophomonas acidaminiphila]